MNFVEVSSIQLITLFVSILVLVTAGLILFIVYVQAMTIRSLLERASQDYGSSRGLVHLDQMTAAHDRLATQLDECNQEISSKRNALSSVEIREQNELRRVLHKYIVSTKLVEVDGIGSRLSIKILYGIYRNGLSDLRQAHRLHGVGESRQYDINQWIDKYERMTPHLLARDFPGKDEIITRYASQRSGYKRSLDQLTRQASVLEGKLTLLNPKINQLQRVTKKDFVNALQDEDYDQQTIDLFQRGIFAEWEEIPDWFKTTVLVEQI